MGSSLDEFVYTSETAGVVAQIVAVLLLATMFSPRFRGSIRSKVVTDVESGERFRVAVRGEVSRWYAVSRILDIGFAALVVLANGIVVVQGSEASGAWALVLACAGAIAIGTTVGMLLVAAFDHMTGERERSANE